MILLTYDKASVVQTLDIQWMNTVFIRISAQPQISAHLE